MQGYPGSPNKHSAMAAIQHPSTWPHPSRLPRRACGPYACLDSHLGSAGFQVLTPPIQIDATLGVGPHGRLLVLMDDRDERNCGHIRGIELWAAFHTSLPHDATVDVDLRDEAGNLIGGRSLE
jgi:hypothetical protein